jgi:hypothetical protein
MLSTRSNSWAITCCTTKHSPLGGACSRLNICACALCSLPLTLGHTCCALSRIGLRAPSLMKLGFLSHWGTQAVLSLALGYARCVPCLSHAVGRARGGVGRSSSKRWGTTAAGGVYSKKNKRKHRGASGVAACAGVRTSGR